MELECIGCTIFQCSGCDTDRCLVTANVREILAVSRQASQRFDVEIFNLRQLNELEVMKQYQVEIFNRFTALDKLNGGRTYTGLVITLKSTLKKQLSRV